MKNLYRILLMLFFAAPLLAADATICTRDWVIWDGSEVILGEIAEIFGVDQLLVAKLNSVYLGDAPGHGESMRLSQTDIKWKMQLAGFDLERIDFSGSYETVIVRENQADYHNNPIAQTVIEFIHKHYAKTGEEFDLHFRNLPEVADNIQGRAQFEVLDSPNQLFRGNVVIVVEAVVEGKQVKKYPVSVKIRTYGEVVVALENIDMNTPLWVSNFKKERRETTNLRETPVFELSDVKAKQAVRNISQNSILMRNQMEALPAIRQGDLITIALKTAGFYITAQGRARKSGGVGETIPVVNLVSLKEIDAVIIDSNTVAVKSN